MFPAVKRRKGEVSTGKNGDKRQSQKMEPAGEFTFHDLPARVKEWAWASFCSAANTLKVQAAFFPAGEDSSFAPTFVAPTFGPAKVVKKSNAKAPSKRTLARAAK